MKLKIIVVFLSLFLNIFGSNASLAAKGSQSSVTELPQTAEVVKIGFYPINIYGVDPSSSTFSYDGYVWFRWSGGQNPTETLEFVNAVDKSSLTQSYLFETPQVSPDGSKYQIMRLEGTFFTPFSMTDFPLDRHSLTIKVEDSLRGFNELVYEIDTDDTGYNKALSVSGWKLVGWSHQQLVDDYGSHFGDQNAKTQASRFAQMNFKIDIERPESYFIWKLLLPLVIVLCGAWIALLLNPALIETRAALPATALLTTVFLQQSYTGTLPETGSLVLLDKIYVVAYILIVATLARIIMKSQNVENMETISLERLRKTDRFVLIGQIFTFVVIAAVMVWQR